MAITEIKNLDFIVYTEKSLHLETIKFQNDKWNTIWLQEIFKDT